MAAVVVSGLLVVSAPARAANVVDPAFVNVTSGAPGSAWYDGTAHGGGAIVGLAAGPGTGGWDSALYFATARNDSAQTEGIFRIDAGATVSTLVDAATLTAGRTPGVDNYTPTDLDFARGGSWGTDLYITDNNRNGSLSGGLLRIDAAGNMSSAGPAIVREPGATAFTPLDWRAPGAGFEAVVGELPAGSPDSTMSVIDASMASASAFATGNAQTNSLAFGPGGGFGTALYSTAGNTNQIRTIDPTGAASPFVSVAGASTVAALAFAPTGSPFSGYLWAFVTDAATSTGGRLVRIDATGVVTTVATGFNGVIPGGAANRLGRLAFSADGQRLYVADYTTQIHQIAALAASVPEPHTVFLPLVAIAVAAAGWHGRRRH